VGWFQSSRSQGTVATPREFPAGIVIAAMAVLLLAWGVFSFYTAARRHAEVAGQADALLSATPAAATPAAPSSFVAPAATDVEPEPQAAQAPTPLAAPPSTAILPLPVALSDEEPRRLPLDACERAVAQANVKFPKDFNVLAAGAYGGRELHYPLGDSGHGATQIDVTVVGQYKPFALMLGAYEPTFWNLSGVPASQVVAIYLSGYHAQRILGFPPNVPVISSSYEERKTTSGCPYFYISSSNDGTRQLDATARRVFGRPVDRIYSGRDGAILVSP